MKSYLFPGVKPRKSGLSIKTWRCFYCPERWELHHNWSKTAMMEAALIEADWAMHVMDCCTVKVGKVFGITFAIKGETNG